MFNSIFQWKKGPYVSSVPNDFEHERIPRESFRSCVIYEGVCSCGEKYVGETNRVAKIRWNEHNTPSKDGSDPSRHLNTNPTHEFQWKILTAAPSKILRRRILESYFIAKFKPKINVQATPRQLFLFRNGITWTFLVTFYPNLRFLLVLSFHESFSIFSIFSIF